MVHSSPPGVTVIIPTRNSSRTLEACLTSIRNQTYQDVEVVVVDNGSTDDTLMTAHRMADAVCHYGPVAWIATSAQRNLGARQANAKYLLFVDSDMRLPPDVVHECVDTNARTGSPAIIIPEISIGEGFWARCRALERSCYGGDDSAEAARFFLRQAFAGAGGYDEDLTALEDWDLSQRVAGGSHLPRISATILHDEGRLRLMSAAAKKRYYGASFRRLVRKHGRRALVRANFVARPAFFRNWRRLRSGGVATPGMFVLKSVELLAAASGALGPDTRNRLRGATMLYPK
jgi:glycosyltransferase involved in cell wall biosynthesis